MDRRNVKQRIEAYIPRLYGYAMSLAGDSGDSNDLVQECALKALRAERVPKDEPAYRAWLFTILRNAWHDQNRRRNRRADVLDHDAELEEIGPAAWSHDVSLISTLTVRICMAKLPPRHREILGLVDVSGFTYSEAAEMLGVPVGTVMSRVSRARDNLLGHLAAGNVRSFPAATRRRREA